MLRLLSPFSFPRAFVSHVAAGKVPRIERLGDVVACEDGPVDGRLQVTVPHHSNPYFSSDPARRAFVGVHR